MSTATVQTPIIYFDDQNAAHVGSTFIDVEAVASSLAPIAIQFMERPGVDNVYRVFNGRLYQASGTSRRLGEPSFLPPNHSWRDRICFWPRGRRMPHFTNGHLTPAPDKEIGSAGVMTSPMLDYVHRAAAHSIFVDNEVYTVDPGPRLHPDIWHLKDKENGRLTLSEYFVNPGSNVMAFRPDELELAQETLGRLYGKQFAWGADDRRRELKVFRPELLPRSTTIAESMESFACLTLFRSRFAVLGNTRAAAIKEVISLRQTYHRHFGRPEDATIFESSTGGMVWPHEIWETDYPHATDLFRAAIDFVDLDVSDTLGLRGTAKFMRLRQALASSTNLIDTSDQVDASEFAGIAI